MEVVMRAVISGLSTVMLFLGAVFWLGDEWRWLMDFLLQLFLFCLLGKFILVPAFFFGYGIQVRTDSVFWHCAYDQRLYPLDCHTDFRFQSG